MALQEGAVGEALGAEAALEALRAVRAHVDVEGALLGEAFAADAALEGADARVGHHVLEQVVPEREGAPADGALVGLLACGDTNVGQLESVCVSVDWYRSVWVSVGQQWSVQVSVD